MAGGTTPDALLNDAQVFHKTENGEFVVLSVNLSKALAGDLKNNILLTPKDRIFVHRNLTKVDPPTVKMEGEVARPGKYALGQDMHSTLGIQSPVKDNVASAPLTELQLVEVPARESAAVRFRRWVAVVEMFVDLCTIVGAVLVSYLAYYDLHFGKHIYYPVRAVVSVACVFGIIAVLMVTVESVKVCASQNG